MHHILNIIYIYIYIIYLLRKKLEKKTFKKYKFLQIICN